MKTHCGHCHTCGSPLGKVLDGEEWCARCKAYRRYRSHGWVSLPSLDASPCPGTPATQKVEIYQSGGKWIYEHDGEIIAVEFSRQMAIACGESRVEALQADAALSANGQARA